MEVINNGVVKSKASKPQKSGETVSVACKLPSGLQLRLFKMVDTAESAPGGPRSVKIAQLTGDEVKINGNSTPWGQQASWPIVGGYGITQGVSKEFMDVWMEQNVDSDLVKNALILVHDKLDFVSGEAEDNKGTRSGLERLTPDSDPRIPRSRNKALTSPKTADEQPKAAAPAA